MIGGLRRIMFAAALVGLGAGCANRPLDARAGSHWEVATTFPDAPVRATPVPGSACATADRYVSLVAARRGEEIGRLFATNAIFLGPEERVLRGRDEIAAFYAANVARRVSHVIPLSFMDRGRECIMEIAIATAEEPGHYRLLAMDHFTIGADGLIERLLIYFRPSLFAH